MCTQNRKLPNSLRSNNQLFFQVGFIGGICLPCYDLMVQVLPETFPMQKQCQSNLDTWKQKAEKRKRDLFEGKQKEEDVEVKKEETEEEEESGAEVAIDVFDDDDTKNEEEEPIEENPEQDIVESSVAVEVTEAPDEPLEDEEVKETVSKRCTETLMSNERNFFQNQRLEF
jgi:hypothetical protein